MAALTVPAQAAESHTGHGQKAQHDHKTHEVDLAPFMIRNAYHFAYALPRCALAERWELAAYQAEGVGGKFGPGRACWWPLCPIPQDFLKEHAQPLQKGRYHPECRSSFYQAFQAAVGGCNDCHKATKHGVYYYPPGATSVVDFCLPADREMTGAGR